MIAFAFAPMKFGSGKAVQMGGTTTIGPKLRARSMRRTLRSARRSRETDRHQGEEGTTDQLPRWEGPPRTVQEAIFRRLMILCGTGTPPEND